ncbi:hypothetical protein GQ55_4G071400 [Panicum hallii var. hallii]|uniref:Uncharacterized protein n=1 Tax=Panicum hallii var. hallii TaxID=1504633 RepID=A0A2T7DW43_9POAL|nr:hypothetical protein GQ55_4G071400 [Panicum hallii var. hallii]
METSELTRWTTRLGSVGACWPPILPTAAMNSPAHPPPLDSFPLGRAGNRRGAEKSAGPAPPRQRARAAADLLAWLPGWLGARNQPPRPRRIRRGVGGCFRPLPRSDRPAGHEAVA